MSGTLVLLIGLAGQWLLGVAVAYLLLTSGTKCETDGRGRPSFVELAGLGSVLGIGLTAWGLFVWSLCGGALGFGVSLGLTTLGYIGGGTALVKSLARSRASSGSTRPPVAIELRSERAWCRLCQWIMGGLILAAFIQTLMTPHRFWDERAIFAIKGLVLFEDGSIHSRALLDPDFVQYHPRYPLLIPLAEQHIYGWLGEVDDRLSKLLFPLLYLGLVLTLAGVLSRHVTAGAAWLFAVLMATVPVLMPHELGFLCGQADAPMACYHGLSILYLWDAYQTQSGDDATSLWIGPSIVAGLCAALAAFTKDEGLAFLMVDVIALGIVAVVSRNRLRASGPLVILVVSSILVLAPWFWHRRSLPLTTEMDYFGRVSTSLVLERLPVLVWEASHLVHRMLWEWRLWGLHWWLMLTALAIAPRRATVAAQWLLLLDVAGSLMALMVAGMLAPAQLHEHISGSSPRFLMQLAPIAVLFVAGQLAAARREAKPHLPDTSKQKIKS